MEARDGGFDCVRTLLVKLALLLSLAEPAACSRPSPASCSIDSGPALEVTGRGDGIYGVVDGRVDRAPLATFDKIALNGTGVDNASGKRWVGLHLADAEARAVGAFTSGPKPRGIAVVVDGVLASTHKVREAISSSDVQVSCCDPRACDHWLKILGDSSAARATRP
jgi:hypothetical protein